jgi:hypothetical protein
MLTGLDRNCLPQYVIGRKIGGRSQVVERRERKHKQPPDDLNETRRWVKFKMEAMDRTLWRTDYGTG